ncbi:ubiquitin-protein transferase [Aureococcus anophagefferens]|uniref:Ubiquitin-protein transferase n=1 Tax=Aureococcus anophagefferens TaxID=44056 RepID=A0ABR1FNJ8_AURAN
MFLGGLRWGEGTGPAPDAELEGDIRSLLGRAGHGAGLIGLYARGAADREDNVFFAFADADEACASARPSTPRLARGRPPRGALGRPPDGAGRGGRQRRKPAPAPASDAKLRALAADVLALCDAAPSGALLCGDLPRLYGRAFGRPLDLGGMKMFALMSRLPGVQLARTPAGTEGPGAFVLAPSRRASPPRRRARELAALAPELRDVADELALTSEVVATLAGLAPEDQTLVALALQSADLARVKNLTGFVLMGLKKGTLLRKGQKREAVRRSNGAPEEFLCPLTLELMRDPVIAADGHTYERAAIAAWLARKSTSPVTNERIVSHEVVPAHTIRSMIARFADGAAVAHAAKGDWQAAIAESGRAHETWESHLRSRAASGAAMDSPMASVDAAVESSLRSLEGTNVSAKEWTPPARAAADSAAAVPPVGTNVAAKEWTPSAATAAAVPPAHPWERVPGGDVNRIFGVVESFQADSGYLRRARHPAANSRDYDVHFRSRDAPEFEGLQAYGASKMSALVSKLPGVHFGGTHRAEARVRAHRAERDAAASGALRYFDRARGRGRGAVGGRLREVAVLMPGSGADRPPGLPHDSVALLKQPGAWPGSFLLRCDPEAYRRDRRGVLDEARVVVGAAARARRVVGARRRSAGGTGAGGPRSRGGRGGPAGAGPGGAAPGRRGGALAARRRGPFVAAARGRRRRARQRQAAGGAPTSGNAAPASAPLPRAAPSPATSAFDGPVAWDELQRRVKAFADALKLDGRCRKTLEAYAVRDADACVRFLRAAPGDLGDHVNESVPLKDRSKYVSQAILHNHLLAASASELNALAPELRSVADALALTSNVAKALKKLSLAQQRRAAERLADPGVMFGVLLRNAFVLAELKKKERGCLLRDDLGNGRVDEDLVAALDGFRLSKDCYRSLRDRSRKKQALCALALESMDLSKITDLSGYIEKGLNKGTLLRKGQELMGTSTPAMASLVSAAAARAGIRREALPAPRDEDNVPEEFLCPISMEIMTDPVIAADGHTYERRAIEAWFGRAHTSPTTNAPLPHLNLIPAHTIKSLIQRHLEQ